MEDSYYGQLVSSGLVDLPDGDRGDGELGEGSSDVVVHSGFRIAVLVGGIMFPFGTRIGYSLVTDVAAVDSVGVRLNSTIFDVLFVARYSAPLHSVAFWIRDVVGTPQRSNLTLALYQDNGDHLNPGTPIESISGGSGTFGTGRLVFSGFSSSLVKGRRYRLRITTSNNVDNNYGEFLLGPEMNPGTYSDTYLTGYASMVRWQGNWYFYKRFNMQVFQTVGSQQISDHVLMATSGPSTGYVSYTTYNNQPFGIRVTMPPGGTYRYWGLMCSRMSFAGDGFAHGHWRVLKGSQVVGVTTNYHGFNANAFPDSSENWGRIVWRFTRPLVLEGGETYDFIYSVAGLHNSSNYASFLTCIIDDTYVPSWFQRYKLLVGGSVVTNRALPTFFLYMDDPFPVPESAGIIDSYVMMPVG
jgi:hypothetical protein